jgi:hypothetical protein
LPLIPLIHFAIYASKCCGRDRDKGAVFAPWWPVARQRGLAGMVAAPRTPAPTGAGLQHGQHAAQNRPGKYKGECAGSIGAPHFGQAPVTCRDRRQLRGPAASASGCFLFLIINPSFATGGGGGFAWPRTVGPTSYNGTLCQLVSV